MFGCVYVDELAALQSPFLKISVPLFSKKGPLLLAFVISVSVLGPNENLTTQIPGIFLTFLSPSASVICNLAIPTEGRNGIILGMFISYTSVHPCSLAG